MIVPLDSSPRWLAAPDIGSLTFIMTHPDSCGDFTLANATIAQRTEADVLDMMLATEKSR